MKDNKETHRYIVVKFGGSSLADVSHVTRAVKAIVKEASLGSRIVVVVSAMGKTTDFLLDTVKRACGSIITNEELDDIVSMGERISVRVFSAVLKGSNIRCEYIDPADPHWPIITDNSFTNAQPLLPISEKLIKKHVVSRLEQDIIVVIPGFIGKTEDGKITTLGRGGSDTTALILAKTLSVDQVILVTNVDGIMTADPKIIKTPHVLKEIHTNSLTGLANSGTKFIHKKALKYKDPSIEVKVINNISGDLNSSGTIIHGSLTNDVTVEMAYSSPTMAITIVGKDLSEAPHVLQSIFQLISDANIAILGTSIDYNSLILYLPEKINDEFLEALHSIVVDTEETYAMAVRKKLAFIKVKGIGLEETPGIISRLSESLYLGHINIFGIFTITSSVLVFVNLTDGEKAKKLIQDSIKSK